MLRWPLAAFAPIVALLGSCNFASPPKRCFSGQTNCSGACVDLATSEDHCGACGTACNESAGFICSEAQCICAGYATDCDGRCVDTNADNNNCGSCGTHCHPCEVCSGGNCKVPESDSAICDGECTDLWSDPENCGACGNVCPDGFTCDSRKCQCRWPSIWCGDECVDPMTSADHCGRCGHACEQGTCSAGKCEPAPDASPSKPDGGPADLGPPKHDMPGPEMGPDHGG